MVSVMADPGPSTRHAHPATDRSSRATQQEPEVPLSAPIAQGSYPENELRSLSQQQPCNTAGRVLQGTSQPTTGLLQESVFNMPTIVEALPHYTPQIPGQHLVEGMMSQGVTGIPSNIPMAPAYAGLAHYGAQQYGFPNTFGYSHGPVTPQLHQFVSPAQPFATDNQQSSVHLSGNVAYPYRASPHYLQGPGHQTYGYANRQQNFIQAHSTNIGYRTVVDPRVHQTLLPGHNAMFRAPGGIGIDTNSQHRAGTLDMTCSPRGPPRKPRQSGHALWVGNLPPGASIAGLKDHFSQDATNDIESVFLISKSNCAFVNYKTEASSTAALQRFHDSRFQGVRLVCRLRRPSASTTTHDNVQILSSAATSATDNDDSLPFETQDLDRQPTSGDVTDDTGPIGEAEQDLGEDKDLLRDRYFVVKSLTLQDLELSVRTSSWSTQSHNEQTLNKAFDTAQNVYLIFSANKSGEYFGYARMSSAINSGAKPLSHALENEPSPQLVMGPNMIPTQATETAPKGRIIDDSARGTIFWEAYDSGDEAESSGLSDAAQVNSSTTIESAERQTWGRPFKIEWLSTNRLPFYRTRGLRNRWNSNREVKIARDGTELEPETGSRLVQMFHRLG